MEPFAGNWILHNQDEQLDSFLKAIGKLTNNQFIRLTRNYFNIQ